jgi:hypothetical protein
MTLCHPRLSVIAPSCHSLKCHRHREFLPSPLFSDAVPDRQHPRRDKLPSSETDPAFASNRSLFEAVSPGGFLFKEVSIEEFLAKVIQGSNQNPLVPGIG